MADSTQVEQILMNLAVNARDSMQNGGRLTIVTENVFLDEDYTRKHPGVVPGPYVLLSVNDTGMGMDEDTLSHLFEPFFTTKGIGLGTGLGMSTVYGVVQQHRGHLAVSSEPGKGSTFRVYFPCVEEPEELASDATRAAQQRHTHATVLVVEDEDVVRNLACEALEMLGYSPMSASDPAQAIKICEEFAGEIHLLLTDVVLPQMDGKTLYDQLSRLRPDMKVLFVSGYAENFIFKRGVLDRGVHFLPKPFTVDRLASKVSDVLSTYWSRSIKETTPS